jgi:glucose/arabinose dehydrogenase
LEWRIALTAPALPLIVEPLTDGQVVSNFDVHMEVDPEAYSDADGDAHHATTWQIRETSANGGAVVWQAPDISDPLSKIHIHLGDGAFVGTLAGGSALLPSHEYVLRATFTDSRGEISAPSDRSFQTAGVTAPVPGQGTWIVHEGFAIEPAATAGAFALPVNITFAPNPGANPDDPLYYVTELYGSIKMVTRSGQVSTYASGLLDYQPTGLPAAEGAQGLTGLAVDPATGDLFVGMLWNNGTSDVTRGGASSHYPKVERLHSADGGRTMAARTVIRNMQPEVQGPGGHQISSVSFGPDGKLYVHMGDGLVASAALDLDQYRGKVLRMNADGSAPTDNPFYDASDGISARDFVYTFGHRNPFGGAWRTSDGAHYVVENGSGLDRMVALAHGQGYGWNGSDTTLAANSMYVWNPATAPVNMAFVEPQASGGSLLPASLYDDAFVTLSGPTYAAGPQARGKRIEWFTDLGALDGSGKLTTAPVTLLRYNGTGRATVCALAAGPDGLYFSDLYRDDGAGGADATGANVYRVRYVDFQPANVAATAGDGRVTVTWTPDALAASYNVYRRSGTAALSLIASGVTGNSLTDTAVANGTQYHYAVRGANAGGESSDSNEATATPTADAPVGGPPNGTGNGLVATYFNNSDLTGTAVVRTYAVVDFDFGTTTPDPFIAADTFSARWIGAVEPRFTETYTFTTTSDDGVRLWVDGVLLIDQWNDHTAATHSAAVPLVAGRRHAIRIEYYQNSGPGSVRLAWQSASQPAETVPQSQLYSGAPIKVNFQPLRQRRSPVPMPAGYFADTGEVFGDRGNGYAYGWNGRSAAGGRDRNRTWSPDQRYDTFLPLRRQGSRRGVWEVAVPAGTYRVHVAAGDPGAVRGALKVNAEGTPVVDGVPNRDERWVEGWADVAVTDGRLTVTSGAGARNNKINFIDVIPLGTIARPAAIASAASAPAASRPGVDATGRPCPPRPDVTTPVYVSCSVGVLTLLPAPKKDEHVV